MYPGDLVVMSVAAGGMGRMGDPGERVDIRLLQPGWVRIGHPAAAAVRAGRAGVSGRLTLVAECVITLWRSEAEVTLGRPGVDRSSAATAAEETEWGGAEDEAGDCDMGVAEPLLGWGLDEWLDRGLRDVMAAVGAPPTVVDAVRQVLGDLRVPEGAVGALAWEVLKHIALRRRKGG